MPKAPRALPAPSRMGTTMAPLTPVAWAPRATLPLSSAWMLQLLTGSLVWAAKAAAALEERDRAGVRTVAADDVFELRLHSETLHERFHGRQEEPGGAGRRLAG